MMALNLRLLAQLSAERAVNCVAEGTVITLLAWILVRAAPRQNSGTRFAVWFWILLTIAALPLLELCASGSLSDLTPSVHSMITLPGSWALYIFMAWAIAASMALLRIGVGFWQVRRLRARCAPVRPENLAPILRTTLEEFRANRPVTLCTSERQRVPTALGFRKPMIVLPGWALREFPTDELHTVLLHELAHLRRRDDWTNLAQKICRALLFFHPAVWWIDNRLSLEREMACDDLVLAETLNPRAYAQCLISVAEKSLVGRGLALAQAVVHRMRQTSWRIAQILDVNRPTATRIWKPALYVAGVLSVGSFAWLSHAPEIVAFRDATRTLVAASQLPAPSSAIVVPASFRQPAKPDSAGAVAAERKRDSRHTESMRARGKLKSAAARFVKPRPDSAPFATTEAKLIQPDSEAAALVQASARGIQNSALNPEAIFVVVQAQPCSDGSWRISIIRFTVYHPSTPQHEKEITAKSI